MKKYIVCYGLTGILLLTSCALFPRRHSQQGTQQLPSKPILIGWLTPQKIFGQIREYQLEKGKYQPDNASLEKLKQCSTDINIIVFLGTWCPDCQREVPRLLKIMDLIQNSHINYKLFGLDRSKRDQGGLAEKYKIEFVPTFVVLQNNKEIGRIVETPMVSLEQDLVEILAPLM